MCCQSICSHIRLILAPIHSVPESSVFFHSSLFPAGSDVAEEHWTGGWILFRCRAAGGTDKTMQVSYLKLTASLTIPSYSLPINLCSGLTWDIRSLLSCKQEFKPSGSVLLNADCCGSSWVLASLRLIGRYFNRSDQFMADFAPHNHVLWLSLWFFRMSLNCLSCPESSYLRSWNQRMFSGISCVCQHGNTRSFNHFVGLW